MKLHMVVARVSRMFVPLLALGCGLLPAQVDWVLQNPAATPKSQWFHSLTYDVARQRVVLFGGWLGFAPAETWEYDGKTWLQRNPATSPPARCCNGIAYDLKRGKVVLFGGTKNTAAPDFNNTWEWDETNWTRMNPKTKPPACRECRLAYDPSRGQVMLFGGVRWCFAQRRAAAQRHVGVGRLELDPDEVEDRSSRPHADGDGVRPPAPAHGLVRRADHRGTMRRPSPHG